MNYVIVGDLNARVGAEVSDLVSRNMSYGYDNPVDQVTNDNGKKILAVCKDNNFSLLTI